ncbi:unnamed protein product [Ectocarpus fasciculatus]
MPLSRFFQKQTFLPSSKFIPVDAPERRGAGRVGVETGMEPFFFSCVGGSSRWWAMYWYAFNNGNSLMLV